MKFVRIWFLSWISSKLRAVKELLRAYGNFANNTFNIVISTVDPTWSSAHQRKQKFSRRISHPCSIWKKYLRINHESHTIKVPNRCINESAISLYDQRPLEWTDNGWRFPELFICLQKIVNQHRFATIWTSFWVSGKYSLMRSVCYN